MAAFLIVFASIYSLVGTVFQASTYFCTHNFAYCTLSIFFAPRTSVHTISLAALFQYFLHPHLSWTRQTFEAFGKLVQTEEHPDSVACQPHT